MEDDDESTADSATAPTIPRNPSDAWQLLKDVATREADSLQAAQAQNMQIGGGQAKTDNGNDQPRGSINGVHVGISTYRLVREKWLTPDVVHTLVARYAEHYHPYLPLVPRKYFDPAQLDTFAANDKHLLTAVLTISSKDLVDQPNVHASCSRYMHDLISGIAAGHDCEVEAVEALLLLAEWEPQGLRNRIEAVGRGEEDRSAWMHVGIALRTGYFLGLDRTAFRQETSEEAKVDSRRRFAWANCYVSDRLISVRIGRAFWSRGPGPMTGLSSQDFPTLQPLSPSDEDYGKIFQAILDLTQLYSNVHDVLYSGMRTSAQMMLMGDYVKYVDDFRGALARWNISWGGLVCSPHIKVTLQMSYEYLCLYTNAFVFQAAISQAIARKPKSETSHSLRDHLKGVFSNVGSMPDARFIWASVAAAKSYLTLLSTQVDPVRHLRYMPLRYYLYGIYSAVFLYKARSFGVMDDQEERQVRHLIHQTTEILKIASVSSEDPGSRYARLLELLWLKNPTHHKPSARQAPGQGYQPKVSVQSPAASDTQLSSTGSLKLDAQGYMQFSPAQDFSWLDLEAVGDYVDAAQMGTHIPQQPDAVPLMAGYDPNAVQSGTTSAYVQQQQQHHASAMGWGVAQANTPGMGWQFDLNGNLPF
jgi:Fungal specific transcription factor domain